jgi:hypothetical protein
MAHPPQCMGFYYVHYIWFIVKYYPYAHHKWIDLAQDRDSWQVYCECRCEPSGSIKCGEILSSVLVAQEVSPWFYLHTPLIYRRLVVWLYLFLTPMLIEGCDENGASGTPWIGDCNRLRNSS